VGRAEVGFAYQVDGDDDEPDARVANFFATGWFSHERSVLPGARGP
jgi:hypothetical protein